MTYLITALGVVALVTGITSATVSLRQGTTRLMFVLLWTSIVLVLAMTVLVAITD